MKLDRVELYAPIPVGKEPDEAYYERARGAFTLYISSRDEELAEDLVKESKPMAWAAFRYLCEIKGTADYSTILSLLKLLQRFAPICRFFRQEAQALTFKHVGLRVKYQAFLREIPISKRDREEAALDYQLA